MSAAIRQRWESRLYSQPNQVLDISTLERCKAESTYVLVSMLVWFCNGCTNMWNHILQLTVDKVRVCMWVCQQCTGNKRNYRIHIQLYVNILSQTASGPSSLSLTGAYSDCWLCQCSSVKWHKYNAAQNTDFILLQVLQFGVVVTHWSWWMRLIFAEPG